MISNDIIDDFLSKLKKEKVEYFIYLAKEPSKKQKKENTDIDVTIAHYQDLSYNRLLILYYCLAKMMVTGEFDPNLPWNGDEEEQDDGGENWKNE